MNGAPDVLVGSYVCVTVRLLLALPTPPRPYRVRKLYTLTEQFTQPACARLFIRVSSWATCFASCSRCSAPRYTRYCSSELRTQGSPAPFMILMPSRISESGPSLSPFFHSANPSAMWVWPTVGESAGNAPRASDAASRACASPSAQPPLEHS